MNILLNAHFYSTFIEEACHTGGPWGPCGVVSSPKINIHYEHSFTFWFDIFCRIPNAMWLAVSQLVAAWKDTLAVQSMDVVMSKPFHSFLKRGLLLIFWIWCSLDANQITIVAANFCVKTTNVNQPVMNVVLALTVVFKITVLFANAQRYYNKSNWWIISVIKSIFIGVDFHFIRTTSETHLLNAVPNATAIVIAQLDDQLVSMASAKTHAMAPVVSIAFSKLQIQFRLILTSLIDRN